MKKSIFAIVGLVVMTSSFSSMANHGNHGRGQFSGNSNYNNNSNDLAYKVTQMSSRLARFVENKAYSMNHYQLKELKKALKVALVLTKKGSGHGGGHSRPQLPPSNGSMVCAQADAYQNMNVFKKIKKFAYSGNGLNQSSVTAKQMTLDWMQKYPCDYADTYIRKFKVLNIFSYGTYGLNMNTNSAKNYSLAKVDTFCEDYPIKSEYKKFYKFAYSSGGLNMNSNGAKKYAKNKIAQYAFNCQVQFY